MNYVIINNSISYLALKFILGDKFLLFRLQTTNEKLIRTCKTTSNSLTVNIFTDLLKTYLMKSTAYEIKITTNRFSSATYQQQQHPMLHLAGGHVQTLGWEAHKAKTLSLLQFTKCYYIFNYYYQ